MVAGCEGSLIHVLWLYYSLPVRVVGELSGKTENSPGELIPSSIRDMRYESRWVTAFNLLQLTQKRTVLFFSIQT